MSRPSRRQRFAIVLLLIVSVVLLVLDQNGTRFTGAREVAGRAFDPVERGLNSVVNPVGDFFSGLPNVGSNTRKLDQLRRENARLRGELRASGLDSARAEELRRLGLLVGQRRLHTVTGDVLDLGASFGFEWAVRINVGSRQGVSKDMTVIDADGLVGRVKQVTPGTSLVVLAADPGSSVGVRDTRTGELGLVTGAGLGPMRYTPLNPRSTVQVGDTVVTGPYGASTYAADVPLGRVAAVTRDGVSSTPRVTIRPFVDFSSLDVVAVVLSQPSRPRPAPSTGQNR